MLASPGRGSKFREAYCSVSIAADSECSPSAATVSAVFFRGH
jgi:hypothetical protein